MSNKWLFSGRPLPGFIESSTPLATAREYTETAGINGIGYQQVLKSLKPLEITFKCRLDAPFQGTVTATNEATKANLQAADDFAINFCGHKKGPQKQPKLLVQNTRWAALNGGAVFLTNYRQYNPDVRTGLDCEFTFREYFPPIPRTPEKPEDAVLPDTNEKPVDKLETLLTEAVAAASS